MKKLIPFFLCLLCAGSCIEPPLHLPGQEILTEMPAVETELSVVWNVDVDLTTDWYYGWDLQDQNIWGTLGYPMPTSYQVRRYYTGDDPQAPHTEVDAFSIQSTRFRRFFSFGWFDMLFWSDIDSPDGTQVLLMDETLERVFATTTGTRGLAPAAGQDEGLIGLRNQPEIFYATYLEDVFISRDLNDYEYNPEENLYIKHIDTQLRPMVYIYLVQIILVNNDGRVTGINGNTALSSMASGINVNTGHTSDSPSVIYFNTRLKRNLVADGKPCDIIGGKFTTFGLCDMEPYTRAGSLYEGSRATLNNKLYFDLVFNNDGVKTVSVDVTDQCQKQAHGGILTVWIDCSQLDPPPGPEQGTSSLFVPTVEDYDNVTWEIEM
jgi:hypothetical protein